LDSTTSVGPVPILVLIDVEPNELFMSAARPDSLSGIEDAFRTLRELRPVLEDRMGRGVHFVWQVRCDNQLKVLFGSASRILETFATELQEARAAGDAVGIHFHAYRYRSEDQQWIEDYGNQAWMDECLELSVASFHAAMGEPPPVASAGSNWLSQQTIVLEERLGIRYETTIVSGRPAAAPRGSGHYTGEIPDYRQVAPVPYRPSRGDYRVADPQRRDGIWIIPQRSGSIPPPPAASTLARLKQFLRHARQGFPQPPVNKLFLQAGYRPLLPIIEKTLSQAENPYLTLIARSGSFSRADARSRMVETLTGLANSPAATRFHFATPQELLHLMGLDLQPVPASLPGNGQ
jgi:hypothetical protein